MDASWFRHVCGIMEITTCLIGFMHRVIHIPALVCVSKVKGNRGKIMHRTEHLVCYSYNVYKFALMLYNYLQFIDREILSDKCT